MVCHGCTFAVCLGMDCPEIKNTAAIIQAITGRLHNQSNCGNKSCQDSAGTGSNQNVAAAERQTVEEIQ